MSRYKNGVDYILRKPGESDSETCSACGLDMNIERNAKVYTSYASAMAGGEKSVMDIFRCPNTGKEWHDKVIALQEEVENTSSDSLKGIITSDIIKILKKEIICQTE